MDSDTMVLINLQTGHRINSYPGSVRDRGIPEGYVDASTLTVDQWIEALQNALGVE